MGKWMFARMTGVMEQMRMEDRQDERKLDTSFTLVRFDSIPRNSDE